jgi:hypothetical protein
MADHEHDDNPFHLPSPSGIPIITGFGIALVLFGFVPDARIWRLSLVSIGAMITFGSIWIWVRDSIDEYKHLPDE